MRLSLVIITRDEEAAVARCIASVPFADEVVVLDSGSRDRTVALARELGARVLESEGSWPGFGPQKNRALALARGEWVLSLDADEWLSPTLASIIEATLGAPGEASAYTFERRSSFCGRVMAHSGWAPDPVTRLFRRGQASFSDDLVHERLLVQGAVRRLPGLLMHESFTSLEEVLEKVNAYSTAGARMLQSRGRRVSLRQAVRHGVWAFVRAYLLKGGFRDGREGFMLAVSNAEGTYYRYLKAYLATRP